jgi:nicotinamide riboside transporter PnuC
MVFLQMQILANHLDWLALVLGAIGSVLWAHNGRRAKYASVWWLVSSLLWIVFAWLNGLPALGLRDVLGVSVALYGCYRWLQPRKRANAIL